MDSLPIDSDAQDTCLVHEAIGGVRLVTDDSHLSAVEPLTGEGPSIDEEEDNKWRSKCRKLEREVGLARMKLVIVTRKLAEALEGRDLAVVAAEAATVRAMVAEEEVREWKIKHEETTGFWERRAGGYKNACDIMVRSNQEWHAKFYDKVEEEVKRQVDVVEAKVTEKLRSKFQRDVGSERRDKMLQTVVTKDTLIEQGDKSKPTYVATQAVPSRSVGGGGGEVVLARAIVIHGVACWQRMADIIFNAQRLRLGSGRQVVGARWLLGRQQRLTKQLSSVVIFFDGALPLRGGSICFGGRICPVEKYDFDRGKQPCDW